MAKDSGGHGSEGKGKTTYHVKSDLAGIRHLSGTFGTMGQARGAKSKFEKQNPGYEGGWRIHSSDTYSPPAGSGMPAKKKPMKKYSRY